MRRYIIYGAGVAVILAGMVWYNATHRVVVPGGTAMPRKIDFNFHIRPILVQKCYLCHGPDPSGRKADLRLDTFEGATAFLKDSVRAIVPGDPDQSALVARINSTDPEMVMPPPESRHTLSRREIDLLTKWIEQGAAWQQPWAFIAPRMPEEVPEEENPVDYFIGEKISEAGVAPAPPAGKHALIRRVAYVLTGLPPTPEALDAFLKDEGGDAYAQMVDRYLSSPGFGERWARHWMDVVRYAETKGHEFDYVITGAWRYRDYLIRAFNNDIPYDQLVREHLAGDLVEQPRRDPGNGTNESHLGTAFLTFTEGTHSPVDIRQDEADRIDNIIDVTTKTFLGLTVSCARCHDHKFDPIKTADYYALYGVMESTRFSPVPATLTRGDEIAAEKAEALKAGIRRMVADQWMKRSHLVKTGTPAPVIKVGLSGPRESGDVMLLGDFRGHGFGTWKTDGLAFGNSTTLGDPLIDPRSHELTGLSEGKASSLQAGPGVFGALRSGDFVIDRNFIGVLAKGRKASVRIIIDNFQLISYPIYGGIDQRVNSAAWKEMKFDVSMWKGHKAFIEVLPGYYRQHVYTQPADAYVEVQYAIAFDERWKAPAPPEAAAAPSFRQTLERWAAGQVTPQEVARINELLRSRIFPQQFPGIADRVMESKRPAAADSTAFYNGVVDGFAINSPVFIRGSYKDPSPHKVRRGFLSAIPVTDSVFNTAGSGRMELAQAMLDPANPLTARVMVNRIWHHVFGRGIVETVDNFGLQGKLPTHPELLDYLALRFRKEGWSLKSMIRMMMLSETFKRAAQGDAHSLEVDPDNLLWSRYPLRRLEAEAIRDGMLAASGALDTTRFGPPVPVYMTPFMQGRGRPATSGPLDGAGRRSIYQEVRRNFLPPMMTTFDTPVPFTTFGRREVTNVPAQSLILMNDPFVVNQAERMATALLKEQLHTHDAMVHWIYRRALSRGASPEELAKSLTFLKHLAGLHQVREEDMLTDQKIWSDYCHSVFNLKEFIYLM